MVVNNRDTELPDVGQYAVAPGQPAREHRGQRRRALLLC
jgi:hypothetical protein